MYPHKLGIDSNHSLDDDNKRWLAPEVPSGKFSTPADIYSFGLIVWSYWHFGEQPYENLREDLPPQSGSRPPFSHCPPLWSQLIGNCWVQEPTKRPPFSEIMQHLKSL